MVYGLSQTPQVWIDHQVTEQNERLVLTWDAVQDIFPAGVLDEMFAAYISLSLRRKIGANYVKRRECRGLLPRE